MATPKQTDPQFKLRLTPELRDQIEVAAKGNNRSMNAEIVERLEESFTSLQREYRHRVEVAELNQQTESLHQEVVDLIEQVKRRDKREIENLAEIKRLRTDRLEFDQELARRQSEIDNLRAELGEVHQILRNYVAHAERLQRIEAQMQLLSERLPTNINEARKQLTLKTEEKDGE